MLHGHGLQACCIAVAGMAQQDGGMMLHWFGAMPCHAMPCRASQVVRCSAQLALVTPWRGRAGHGVTGAWHCAARHANHTWHYGMPSHAMPCRGMRWCIVEDDMACPVMQCHAIPCVGACLDMGCLVMPCQVMPRHPTPWHDVHMACGLEHACRLP